MENVYDENGQPIEGAFSKAEMEEAQQSAEEAKAAEIQALKDEASAKETELQEKLDEAKEALEKKSDKDLNFQKLREAKKTAEEKLADFKEETTKKFGEIEDKVLTSVQSSKVDNQIDKLVGDDLELKKKVRFHYDNFKETPKTDEEMKERIANSYLLATGKSIEDSLPSGTASSGGGLPPKPSMPNTGKLEDEGSKEVAKNLGISDDELKNNKLI
jgi:hypothetical protein